jgi:ABC-type transport system involved in multi-copper enzyme maturation permease subunit
MIALAVIERELRAASRHTLTYNLRVLGVLVFLGMLGIFWLSGSNRPGVGGYLFAQFHRILFFGIWFFVPLMTADCISRERREGTLSLLFLTPLNRRDVVYAKGLVHGLRSLTLWLAVVPIFTICFLAGGVGWPEVIISSLINLSSICLALSAGMVASSRTRVLNRALAVAATLAGALFFGFLYLLPCSLFIARSTKSLVGRLPFDQLGAMFANGFSLAVNYDGLWQRFSATLTTRPMLLFWVFGASTLVSICALYSLLGFSAWNLRRNWQDNPTSPRISRAKETLFKPVIFRKQLRLWLNWQLQRNPVGWLEQRSWSGRMVVWSWFAVVMCVYSSLFSNLTLYQRSFHAMQTVMALLLAASIAAAASSSFRRERETGVLELLLVSPLSEWQIIKGRVRGIWTQFLPAVGLLLGLWLYTATFIDTINELPFVLSHAVTFATLPIVGLYYSLTKPSFMAGLMWTVAVQILVPAIVLLLYGIQAQSDFGSGGLVVLAVGQIVIASLLSQRLWLKLKTREFAHGALVGG